MRLGGLSGKNDQQFAHGPHRLGGGAVSVPRGQFQQGGSLVLLSKLVPVGRHVLYLGQMLDVQATGRAG